VIELDAPAPAQVPPPRRRPGPGLSRRRRRQFSGAAGICVVAALIAFTILAFDQVFTPGIPATVVSARAGMLMDPGAAVTLDGVTVGRVTSISPVGGQARLGVSLDPGQVRYIPANVRASIQAPTIFGPKYLSLVMPGRPAAQTVRAGQVIEPTQTPTEIDTVFANLVSVLDSVHPAKLAATLGAISTALQGRGTQLGDFIAALNDYVKQFNPELPAVKQDLGVAPRVLGTYASAAPDLVKTLGNLSTTSGTLVSQQAQFDAFLVNLTGMAGTTQSFLASNEQGLAGTMRSLLPTSGLLAGYSPEFPCLFASINTVATMSNSPALKMNATFLPGVKGYSPTQNLPVIGADTGPSCYGGPINKAQAAHWPRITFNDGTQNFFSSSENLTVGNPPLATQLFGTEGAQAADSAAKNSAAKNSAAKHSAAESTGKGR
jgi:phospholipid/cholesterol/gamma-HCH transport system substrate-binding protein